MVHTWTWPLNVCWPNVEEFQITHFNFSKYFTCWNFCYWRESFVTYYFSIVYIRDSHIVRNQTNPLDPPFEDQKQSPRDCNNRENAKSFVSLIRKKIFSLYNTTLIILGNQIMIGLSLFFLISLLLSSLIFPFFLCFFSLWKCICYFFERDRLYSVQNSEEIML